MSVREVLADWLTQPDRPGEPAFPGLRLITPRQAGSDLLNRRSYTVGPTQDGLVLVPTVSNIGLDCGADASGSVFGILLVLDVRVAALTSASTTFRPLASIQDSTSGVGIAAGAYTASLTGESLGILPTSANRSAMTDTLAVGRNLVCIYWDEATTRYKFRLNGAAATEIHTATPAEKLTPSQLRYFHGRQGAAQPHLCPALIAISSNQALDLREFEANPWALFEPSRIIIPVSAAGGGAFTSTGALETQAATASGSAAHVTLHTTTGALSAQAATIAGAADSPHLSTGAPSAEAAIVAGSAAHATLHATSGALTAQAATVSGAAAKQHATTGALASDVAAVAGTSAHLTLHTTTGALSSQAATVVGDSALESDAFDATGSLSAEAAAVVGAAQRFALHTTTGAVAAGAATVAGTALHPHLSEGAVAAGPATVAGSAAHLALHTSTGALDAAAAQVSGSALNAAEIVFDANGALSAQNAAVAGVAARLALHDATGDLEASAAALAALAMRNSAGAGAEVWGYLLSNGLTAGDTLVAILECCQAQQISRIEKLLRNKQITDPVAGTLTVYDDDGVTPLLTGALFEDAAGSLPYRGQGAERRERLE